MRIWVRTCVCVCVRACDVDIGCAVGTVASGEWKCECVRVDMEIARFARAEATLPNGLISSWPDFSPSGHTQRNTGELSKEAHGPIRLDGKMQGVAVGSEAGVCVCA